MRSLLIPTQFVWFLAPTVALANQQHDVISTQLPVFQTRFLSGADGVDCWNEQIWDEVLAGIKIVVSTHQVRTRSKLCPYRLFGIINLGRYF